MKKRLHEIQILKEHQQIFGKEAAEIFDNFNHRKKYCTSKVYWQCLL